MPSSRRLASAPVPPTQQQRQAHNIAFGINHIKKWYKKLSRKTATPQAQQQQQQQHQQTPSPPLSPPPPPSSVASRADRSAAAIRDAFASAIDWENVGATGPANSGGLFIRVEDSGNNNGRIEVEHRPGLEPHEWLQMNF